MGSSALVDVLPKDMIPALTEPRFADASSGGLKDHELVIGVRLAYDSRAYPLAIMNYHEIVNDAIANIPVAVTYCPLRNSALVFDPNLDNEVLTFKVSGKLFENALVMYDTKTDSLWPQLRAQAITGVYSGRKLKPIPSVLTSWAEWNKQNPKSLVLTRPQGYGINYDFDPYAWRRPMTLHQALNPIF